MVTPVDWRRAIETVRRDLPVNERRACRALGVHRSSIRYRSWHRDDAALRARLRELAAARRRFGRRLLMTPLRREGRTVNAKRVHRLYREEGLSVRRRAHRCASRERTPRISATRPGQRRSLDFMSDTIADGGQLRLLNVVDEFTRACLAIEVGTSMPALRVCRVLDRLDAQRGCPEVLVMDNGPEFAGTTMQKWATAKVVKQQFITPGPPRGERVHREFQRAVSRRVSQRELVREPSRSAPRWSG